MRRPTHWIIVILSVSLLSMVLLATTFKSHRTFWRTLGYRIAFEIYLHRDSPEIEKESVTGDAGVYYFTSYYLNGLLSGVEATQSERLLKRSVNYLNNMTRTAVPFHYQERDYRVWGPFVITPGSPNQRPNVHYTLQAAVPMARAAAIIKRNPEFFQHHRADWERYTTLVKSAVFDFWYRDQYAGQIPWLDTENVPIWNDNATNMGLCAVFMYEATGEPLYAEIAKNVGEAFRRKLTETGRGWIWESNTIPIGSDTDNTPGSVGNQAGVPDTSHANREPMLMVFLHEAGLLFSEEDIHRMGYTLVDSIWNQSFEDPSFANYINGSNAPYRVYKLPGLNGPIYHGWAFVGGYSHEAQNVLVATLKAIIKGRRNPSLERNETGYGGMLGLTGQILRNNMILNQTKTRPTSDSSQ